MSVVEYEVGRQPGPPSRKRVEVDPITLRVLGGAFHAIAKEMAGVLFRMSYSSIIRESEDLGAGIFDAEGRELCESDSTPMHIGSLPWYIRGFLWRLEGEIEEGDVIVHNHPYLGASHSPDVAVAVPIFHDGELLGFAAVTAHVLDVGGSFPGINADAFDVYAEATGGRGVSTRLELAAPGDGAARRPWALRSSDVDLHGHVNNAVHWQAVEDGLRDSSVDAYLPLVAELDYRDPIDLADDVELLVGGDAQALCVGFRVGEAMRAVARVAAGRPPGSR